MDTVASEIGRDAAGRFVAARFVVALISPRPRGRTIHIAMPEDDDCNVVAVFNATLRGLCNGEITPDEALQVSRFLDGRRRTLQAWQLEMQLRSHGRTIPGDPDWEEEDADGAAPAADDDEAPAIHDAPAVRPAAPVGPAAPEAAASSVPPGSASPPAAAAGAAAALPPLQSACISPSPRTVGGSVAAPSGGRDAAPAASILCRVAGGSDQG